MKLGEKEGGAWKFLDTNTIFARIINVDHVLTFDGKEWTLVFPVRNPPTVMRNHSVIKPIEEILNNEREKILN